MTNYIDENGSKRIICDVCKTEVDCFERDGIVDGTCKCEELSVIDNNDLYRSRHAEYFPNERKPHCQECDKTAAKIVFNETGQSSWFCNDHLPTSVKVS